MPRSCRTSSMPAWLMLIMKIGPLPNAAGRPPERCRTPPERCRTPSGTLSGASRAPPGRTGTRNSRRKNALDPGFHGVPAGPIHPDRAADGAGVMGACYCARAPDRATSKPPDRWCLWVWRCPCALWCAGRSPARSALRPCRPTVPSDLPSSRAVRGLRPCRPPAPAVPSSGSGVLRPGVPLRAGLGSIGTRGKVRR